MTKISLIAAIDEENGLGFNNQLLCHLPADLNHFKQLTLGKPIVMGRRTYESIGRPLPNRQNIILSNTLTAIDKVQIYPSLQQALAQLDQPEIMIIGGERLFREAIDIAQCLYITHIHHRFHADVFFPAINPNLWCCSEQEYFKQDEKNPFDLTFASYIRR